MSEHLAKTLHSIQTLKLAAIRTLMKVAGSRFIIPAINSKNHEEEETRYTRNKHIREEKDQSLQSNN
jgi:hypothetical protein